MTDLRRMRQLMAMLPNMLWEIEQKEANATRITTCITGMPAGGGGTNKTEEAVISLVSVKDAYREAITELNAMRAELEPILLEIEDYNERAVMRLRYINGYDPKTIAGSIHIDERTVYRWLKNAERKVVSKCQ